MGTKPRIEPEKNTGDKHGNRWKTRRTVRPNVPGEKKSNRYIKKYGNKFETTVGTNTDTNGRRRDEEYPVPRSTPEEEQ